MLIRQLTFPVDADRLWGALADPSPWIGADVAWDLVPGGEVRFRGDPDGDRAGQVDAVEPGRRLSFRWWPAADRDEESEVTYELEPAGESTRLTVTERRLGSDAAPQAPALQASAPTVSAPGVSAPGVSAAWSCWDGHLAGLWATAVRLAA